MAISRTYQLHHKFAALLLAFFFLSLTLLPLKSGGSGTSMAEYEVIKKKMKMVLGSRPPACVNRCMSCRPCEATLVIPSKMRGNYVKSSYGQDDTYYLLSWKCRCGNKLYQP